MSDERPRNEAAMADILASIRKIVADEDRLGAESRPTLVEGDILLLTPEMRLPPDEDEARRAAASFRAPPAAPPQSRLPEVRDPAPTTVDAPEGALTLDEATVADIARAVLREEFDGPFGRALTSRIEAMVRAEVARALQGRGDRRI